jgi:hypothetical protein
VKKIHVKKYKVRTLWSYCEQGLFAVPEIQREFVWNAKQAANLLDSIYRKLPIGNILVWETSSNRKHLLRHEQTLLPRHEDHNSHIWFLIDGQQRLSVLYRAKRGDEVTNSNGKKLDFGRLCFSFDKRYEQKFIFVRKPSEKIHIPVEAILSSRWKAKTSKLSAQKKREIAQCRELLSSYELPLTILHTDDLDEVRETFLRINSGGLRISKADRAFSKASRLDLRRLVRELRVGLPHSFNQIDPQVIQRSMAFMLGQKEGSAKSVEIAIDRLEAEEIEDGHVSTRFTKKWREMSDSIRKAVDYLCTELGVLNFSHLPSDNMVALLAFFYYQNNRAQPNAAQKREIRKWFWATAVGRRYVGRGYDRNIRSDLAFFDRLGKRRSGRFSLSERIPILDVRRMDYQVSGSLTIAYFLMLAKHKPSYFSNGAVLPLDRTASISNRKDKHHIFPKALLTRNKFTVSEANSICNLIYLDAEENQMFGSNKPIVYLESYKRKKHFSRVMKSHLIPYRGDSHLWDRNVRSGYRKFISQRLSVICKAFEKEAGIPLFMKQ